jgi:type VI secretion system protein ImpH
MAGTAGAQTGAVDLYEQLRQAPHLFDFFQALRRLECAHPDKPRWGESLRPADDPVRFCQEASLAFANCTLPTFSPGENGRPWRLATNFMGFLGPNGPLPLHLAEFARDRVRNEKDPTFVRFLDLFVHRLVSLFYRARSMSEPTIQFDRPETDRFALYIGALLGLGQPSLRDRDALPDHAKLHFAGHFACAVRSAARLQSVLSKLLSVPAVVEEFVAHWMLLPDDCRCRLGASPSSGTLGESAILGERVADCQHKFRVILGPLERDEYTAFLPGGPLLTAVEAIIRNFLGDEFSWDLRLVLKREKVTPVQLGKSGQLQWTTWIGDYPAASDADDLTLNPEYIMKVKV